MKKKTNNIKINLIKAGIYLFGKNGYHGTGIKEIVESQGIPKGSFYNYFKSKEEFTSEIINYYAKQIDEFWNNCLEENSNKDPLEMLKLAFEKMISMQEFQDIASGCLIGNLAAELAESSDNCRLALDEVKNSWMKLLIEQLVKGQKYGSIRQDLPAVDLAGFCWDVWEGTLLRMKLENSSISTRRTISILINNFLKI